MRKSLGSAAGGLVRERQPRDAPGAPERRILEPFRRTDDAVLMERRAVGLDRDNGFHEIRAGVGDFPAERPGLRMREQDRRADFIEQRRAGIAVQFFERGQVRHVLDLRRKKLVKRRIAGDAFARPLGMQRRLRITLRQLGAR